MPRAPDTTLIIQTGDYAEAFDRFRDGGPETFRDQRRSVNFVEERARSQPLTVVAMSREPYDRLLAPGLRAIGLTASAFYSRDMGREVLRLQPAARLILRTPVPSMLEASTSADVPTLACFADLMRPVRPR